MRRHRTRTTPALLAILMLLAAGTPAPAAANGACTGPCPPAGRAPQTLVAEQTDIAADQSARCRQLTKDSRLALALFGMCHSFAEPGDRLCADYSSACQRLRDAGCDVDWARCE